MSKLYPVTQEPPGRMHAGYTLVLQIQGVTHRDMEQPLPLQTSTAETTGEPQGPGTTTTVIYWYFRDKW